MLVGIEGGTPDRAKCIVVDDERSFVTSANFTDRGQSRTSNRPFQELLQYYAIERFLYRLSSSAHRTYFVLKGALSLGGSLRAPAFRSRLPSAECPEKLSEVVTFLAEFPSTGRSRTRHG